MKTKVKDKQLNENIQTKYNFNKLDTVIQAKPKNKIAKNSMQYCKKFQISISKKNKKKKYNLKIN